MAGVRTGNARGRSYGITSIVKQYSHPSGPAKPGGSAGAEALGLRRQDPGQLCFTRSFLGLCRIPRVFEVGELDSLNYPTIIFCCSGRDAAAGVLCCVAKVKDWSMKACR